MTRPPWRGMAASLAVTAALLAAWAGVCLQGWVAPVFLPSPQDTLRALQDGLAHGDMLALSAATVERMAWGWGLASLAGLVLGVAIGSSAAARAWLQPMLELVRPLPASALLPVAIALFGLSPTMVLAVIAFGAVWPVLLSTVHGMAAVDERLHEVARVLGLSRAAFLWKIALPRALPDALAGMRLSLTVALILAVVGEMLGSQPGLGTHLLLAARSFRAADLFAGVAVLGAVGFASNALLGLAERRLLRWQTP